VVAAAPLLGFVAIALAPLLGVLAIALAPLLGFLAIALAPLLDSLAIALALLVGFFACQRAVPIRLFSLTMSLLLGRVVVEEALAFGVPAVLLALCLVVAVAGGVCAHERQGTPSSLVTRPGRAVRGALGRGSVSSCPGGWRR